MSGAADRCSSSSWTTRAWDSNFVRPRPLRRAVLGPTRKEFGPATSANNPPKPADRYLRGRSRSAWHSYLCDPPGWSHVHESEHSETTDEQPRRPAVLICASGSARAGLAPVPGLARRRPARLGVCAMATRPLHQENVGVAWCSR